jgi:hypothetical protein
MTRLARGDGRYWPQAALLIGTLLDLLLGE